MKWSRSWDDIAGFMRRVAVGETVSHLRVLEIDGVVVVEDGEPALWSLTDKADCLNSIGRGARLALLRYPQCPLAERAHLT